MGWAPIALARALVNSGRALVGGAEWSVNAMVAIESQGAAVARIAVLDPTGAVARWVADGRPVDVWENVDLSSYDVGGRAFTPGAPVELGAAPLAPSAERRAPSALVGDSAGGWSGALGAPVDASSPGWRYRWVERIASADAPARFAFFARGDTLGQWSDTPAGWRAAWRAVGAVERASAAYARSLRDGTLRAGRPGGSWAHVERMHLGRAGVELVDVRAEWTAPIGTFARAWTVERLTWETAERVHYPLAPSSLVDPLPPTGVRADGASSQGPGERPRRALSTLSGVAIVVWYAQLGAPTGGAGALVGGAGGADGAPSA